MNNGFNVSTLCVSKSTLEIQAVIIRMIIANIRRENCGINLWAKPQWHSYVWKQMVFKSKDNCLFSVAVGALVVVAQKELLYLLFVEPHGSQSVRFKQPVGYQAQPANPCRNHHLPTGLRVVQRYLDFYFAILYFPLSLICTFQINPCTCLYCANACLQQQ